MTPAASVKTEAPKPSQPGHQAPSASDKPQSTQAKGEKESPAAKDEKLTAQHLPIGAVVETKSGKTGVITHVHKKSGYLFIHNAEAGKTYHVSMASITNVSGESVADILAKQGKGDGLGEDVKAAAEKMAGPIVASCPAQANAWAALQSHGWKPVKKDSFGAVTFAHPKLGGQFHVDVDGTLINPNSGTEIKPEKAAEYLRGFHSNSEKQAEGAAKQKDMLASTADHGLKPGDKVNAGGFGHTVDRVSDDGVILKDEEGNKTDVSAKDAADYMKTGHWKKEGPGSRGSTKWYYDKHGQVQYGEAPKGYDQHYSEGPAEPEWLHKPGTWASKNKKELEGQGWEPVGPGT